MVSATRIFGQCRRVLNSRDIDRIARKTGFHEREARKLGAVGWLWTVVMGAGSGPTRSTARLARLAAGFSLTTITRQGFHQRFTPEGVEFMREILGLLSATTADLTRERLPGDLASFRDIHAFDSTTLALVKRLAERFPACRTNVRPAALKIHTRMSLRQIQAEAVRITPERVHDRRGMLLEPEKLLRGLLLLFDLGYFDYDLFGQIIRAGGDFVTRLKETANGTILNVRRGCGRRQVGEPLNQAIYEGGVVDLDVEFGGAAKAFMARVVGLRNRDTGDYHWYLTTLDADAFPADQVAELYRLRWQIELLYKNWKSLCHLKDLASGKEEVVLAMVYASLCFAALSRLLSILACRRYGLSAQALSPRIATSIVGEYAVALGQALTRRRTRLFRELLATILESLAVHASPGHRAILHPRFR